MLAQGVPVGVGGQVVVDQRHEGAAVVVGLGEVQVDQGRGSVLVGVPGEPDLFERVEAAGDDFDDLIPQHPLGAWRQGVGARALPRLQAFQAQTEAQASARMVQLRAQGLEVVGDAAANARGTWPVLLLRMASNRQRNAVLQALWGADLGLSLPFVHVLPDYARYDHVLGSANNDALPRARDWAGRLLAISNSPWMDEARFQRLLGQLATTGT